MIRAWRIAKAKHADHIFDGEGARVHGGRWTSPGHPVVYTAGSASLAVLEMLVHIGRPSVLPAYVLAICTFDETGVARLDRSRLPANWRSYPAPAALQQIGNEWLASGTHAVLEVPSVIVETESNYLLNPQHAGFRSLQLSPPEPFELDLRLLV